MKKFLLLLVAVVLAGGLVLSCSQPSSYDITLKAGSAEGVAPDSIKVEAINGYNLITWQNTPDTGNTYTVYRKTIIDGEIDEGTIIANIGSPTVTPIKGIAWAQDTNIVADAQYVYGVVSRGYKDNTSTDVQYVSEIVWQNEPEGGYVTAKKPAAGTELPVAPAVTATAVRANSSKNSTTGQADVSDGIVFTVKGLVPGYSYTFGIVWRNQVTPASASPASFNEIDWGYWGGGFVTTAGGGDWYRGWTSVPATFTISDYLDYGDTIDLSEVTLQFGATTGSASYFYDYDSTTKHYLDSWSGRLYVRYGAGQGVAATYPVTQADQASTTGTRFNSNEVKLLDIAK
jgi:hypothetical protein